MGDSTGGRRRRHLDFDGRRAFNGNGRELLSRIPQWRLSAESWDAVAAALARWQAANAVGDRPAGERARRELAALGLLAVRLGEAPPPGTGPLPPPIRQRLNVLVHELGGTLEAPPPDAETTPDPAPLAFAARVTRRLAEMPVFDRAGVAFAGTDADRRASQQTAEVAGLRIVRRMADRTTVEVVVTAGRETNGNDLVALSVRAGTDPGTLFLLPLWRYSTEEPFVATARIRLRSARISMAVIPPFPARRLTGDDAAAIARSIAVTTNSGRDAWRRIAAARLPDDPVRTAVLEATRT